MKYMGSKNRIAKYLLPIILKDRKPSQYYVEPFVGGANMIDKVDGLRIGSDSNKYLIALHKKLASGWLPQPKITKDDFEYIKKNKDKFVDHVLGYVGFQLSYGAMWFGSYRRDNIGKRDYSLEAFNNVYKQSKKLRGIDFKHCTYSELSIPDNSIIYCDPPYKNTASYKAVDVFDHDIFFDWVRDKVISGHTVFISEYNAPEDFVSIWQKEIVSSLAKDTGSKKGIEKLFVHKSQYQEGLSC